MIADLSSGRPANPFERKMYVAAAHDPVVYAAFEGIGSRRRSPLTIFNPRVLMRVALAGKSR